MERQTVTINAIHDRDLKPFLKKRGIWKQFKNGKIQCKNCGKIITWDNLGALKPLKGEIKMVCDMCITNNF